MQLRKLIATLTVSATILTPFSAFAREVSDYVDTSAKTITQANFLSWAFEALSIPKTVKDCTLPSKRVPTGMKATLCTAQSLNALAPLGDRLNINAAIKKGQALEVISKLSKKPNAKASISGFSDLSRANVSSSLKQAVMNALEYKWMVPESASRFGVLSPLKGSEALTLLQAASGNAPSITIRLNSQPSKSQSNGVLPNQELLETIWELIQRDYLRSDKIDKRETGYKLIEGLVDSLDDPYSSFFRPANASDFSSQIKGEVTGIGAHIEDKNGIITVITPLPGSPAEKAGIQPGDEILEAGGVVLKDLGLEKAVSYIRGDAGTSVVLKLRRQGIELSVTVKRDLIVVPEVRIAWQGEVAVVQLLQFGDTTDQKIRSVMEDIAKKNPKGLILDLRNNPGGLLHAADMVMSNFVPTGSIVAQVKAPSELSYEKTSGSPTISDSTRMVVLVNKGSASASEIVAGALQDHKRATVIGMQTFGKGTVQEVIGFKTGEALKLTIAEWLTPNGRKIDGLGVTPDIVVEDSDRDLQMQRALDLLR